MPKIVFLTYHNWESKRQGGFHKLAEGACERQYETVFFSFPRPLWALFRKSETFGFKTVWKLIKGVNYTVKNNNLLNICILSFALPLSGSMSKFFPFRISNFFEKLTIPFFSKFARKKFAGAEYFVFESTVSVLLVEAIRKMFPDSKIIYRPSDPLVAFPHGKRLIKYEINLLKKADKVFLVNQNGLEHYKKYIGNFEKEVNYTILPNGADISLFKQKYQIPEELKKQNTALYVGVLGIDWDMIIEAASLASDINFIIVCPVKAPNTFISEVKSLGNITYINGINRNEVPKWVTNADVIIVPYPKNWYKSYPWGMTAKYYQAMAAQKPIVSYHDHEYFSKYGISVTYNTQDFIAAVRNSIGKKCNYNYPFYDWKDICDKFYKEISNI
jgi:hypothetical protein